MGSCLQSILRSQRSQLRRDSLLNYQELSTIVKPSTQNDSFFLLCHNVPSIQKFLNQFTQKPNTTAIDTGSINTNIKILTNFVYELRDRTSQIGSQIPKQQQRLKSYLKNQEGQIGQSQSMIRNNIMILKLELQVLLLPNATKDDIYSDRDCDIMIEIMQEEAHDAKKMNKLRSSMASDNQADKNWDGSQKGVKQQIIQRVMVDIESQIKKKGGSLSKNRKKQQKMIDDKQIEEYGIYSCSSKIVKKTSIVKISMFKVKKNRNVSHFESIHQDLSNSQALGVHDQLVQVPKNKILIGQTCLSAADFIYYNSLIISDVVSLSPPTSIKSSITTASSSTSTAVAFISIRGQGLRAQTLEKDYIKIIKQHEIIIQQLQMCLQGEKGWEKLSEFRNSNESKKGQSLYSDYSAPVDRMYKI